MNLGFACPYLDPDPKAVISQLSALSHAAWRHPWRAVIGTIRTPHIEACELLVKRALENPTLEALFWTEDDCILPLDAASKLIDLLEMHPDVDIATGITFMRHAPHHPMIATYAGLLTEEILEAEKPVLVFNRSEKSEPIVGQPHYRFLTRIDTSEPPFQIDAASMNCLLIRRRALEVIASIPNPFRCDEMATPDFALFHRLRGKLKTYVDPSILTGHIGKTEIGFDHWVVEMQRMVKAGDATVEVEPSRTVGQTVARPVAVAVE